MSFYFDALPLCCIWSLCTSHCLKNLCIIYLNVYGHGVYLLVYLHSGEQVHVMCMMEELMPSLGTPVPSSSVLAVVISRSDSTLQNVRKSLSDGHHNTEVDVDFDNPFDFCDESQVISKRHLLSISDDGKIWNWLLTAEGPTEHQKDASDVGTVAEISKDKALDTNAGGVDLSFDSLKDVIKQTDKENIRKGHSSAPKRSQDDLSLKVET